MSQEREVFTAYVQGTNKTLNGLRDHHRLHQTVGSKFSAQNWKVAFIVDNCLALPHVSRLTAIDLIFSPPNTTCVIQSLDQS